MAITSAELGRHPPPNDPQQLESALVGPLHVLENCDPRTAVGSEDRKERRDDPVSVGIGEGCLQVPSDLLGDVEYRREGPGRDDGVTDSPKHSTRTTGGELVDQGALAYSRRAAYKYEPTATPSGLREQAVELLESVVTLENAHGSGRTGRSDRTRRVSRRTGPLAGTLYVVIAKLEEAGLIEPLPAEERGAPMPARGPAVRAPYKSRQAAGPRACRGGASPGRA